MKGSNIISDLLLLGAGPMAHQYSQVLSAMNVKFLVIGRGEDSAKNFTVESGKKVDFFSLEACILNLQTPPNFAIVAVSREELAKEVLKLLRWGVKNILVEKPASYDLDTLRLLLQFTDTKIYVGFNRRFYSNVTYLLDHFKSNGFPFQGHFNFCERIQALPTLQKRFGDFNISKWFLGNSIHVVDLFFYLMGNPENIDAEISHPAAWHPSGLVFSGSGKIKKNGAEFSYNADWRRDGNWSIDIESDKFLYHLGPLEELHVIEKRSKKEEVSNVFEDFWDQRFKPGLYRQVDYFLNQRCDNLCDIESYMVMFPFYLKMAGYNGND
jgi:predicted dehydrogenase